MAGTARNTYVPPVLALARVVFHVAPDPAGITHLRATLAFVAALVAAVLKLPVGTPAKFVYR